MIDETELYRQDHPHRCLEYIQHFFEQAQYPYVQAVYVMGSVVTGDYHLGYSDLDIIIFTNAIDLTELMDSLRALNAKLWIVNFHLLKPNDVPPPDLLFTARLLAESELLFGQDLLSTLNKIPGPALRHQLLLLLSQQIVSLRAFYCSKVLEKYKPDKIMYDAQKLSLFGLRALLLVLGEKNTQRQHIINYVTATENILTPMNQQFFFNLLDRFEKQQNPDTHDECLLVLQQTISLLEEVQAYIFKYHLGNS
ncbi:MAG: nucleotidyltransferase domain-containing protein [Anaerolineae bacterium]|nr:nucleotidyltransferase domain-containing protein [Anaerolineae bacterium]